MADIIPTFELISTGAGTLTTEAWVDLGPIPTGKKVWVGFASFIAEDKALSFELRTNKSTKSAGTTGDTTLHDYAAATTGDGVDRDLFRDGHILVMSCESTGVERWWLRIRSSSANLGAYDYFIYYTEY